MRIIIPFIGLITVGLILSSCAINTFDNTQEAINNLVSESTINTMPEFRGAWITTVCNIDFPSAPDLPKDDLINELDSIIKMARSMKLNTLIFQVHPCSDAMYRSDLFQIGRASCRERV